MTTPGSGGSGFEYGPDSVAARLSVEVPPEGIQTLHQLSKEAENLRVQMEALVRAEGNHIDMVRQMADIHNQVANSTRGLTEEMTRLANSNNQVARNQEGISSTYWGAPAGTYIDPFNGVTAGMGRMDAAVQGLVANDPRGFLNAQAQHGNLTAEDLKSIQGGISPAQIQEIANTIAAGVREGMADEMNKMGISPGRDGGDPTQARPGGRQPGGKKHDQNPDTDRDTVTRLAGVTNSANLASQFANELGAGGSFEGMARSVGTMTEMMGGANAESGIARLFGVAGKAGPIGAAISAGIAAGGLVQMGGEQFQQYKNLGSIQGGGATQGFGMEMAARAMSLNPFISTEQSRQVIQSALSEGYQGKQFDKITDYLATNLREMNMQVGDSMKLVKSNVQDAGESLEGLSATLGGLKESSKSGGKSFDEIKEQFAQIASVLSQGGVNQGTNNLASTLSLAFKDNKELGAVAGKMANATFSDPYGSQFALTASTLSRSHPELANMKPLQQADYIGRLAQQNPGEVVDAMFAQYAGQDADSIYAQLQQYGITGGEAQQLAQEIAAGRRPGAAADRSRIQGATAINRKGLVSRFTDPTKSAISGIFGTLQSAWKNEVGAVGDLLTGNQGNLGHRFDEVMGTAGRRFADFGHSGAEATNPTVEAIIQSFGANGIEVFQGNRQVQANLGSEQTLKDLASGKLTWRPKGSSEAPMRLQDSGNIRDRDSFSKEAKVSGQVAIQVTAGPGLNVKAPKYVNVSSNQAKAYAGYGEATLNNPPPGG